MAVRQFNSNQTSTWLVQLFEKQGGRRTQKHISVRSVTPTNWFFLDNGSDRWLHVTLLRHYFKFVQLQCRRTVMLSLAPLAQIPKQFSPTIKKIGAETRFGFFFSSNGVWLHATTSFFQDRLAFTSTKYQFIQNYAKWRFFPWCHYPKL